MSRNHLQERNHQGPNLLVQRRRSDWDVVSAFPKSVVTLQSMT